ncbi:MAG: DHA2 family efflux MFS transporter permease subunit [Ilumatobacteraceae bacterium]
MSDGSQPDRSPTPARSPWVAVGVVLVGSYAAVLNITVVGVALPAITDDLRGGGAPGADWVVTTFLIGVVVVQPLTAWAADRFGRSRVYVVSLLAFAAGSLLCALAPGMWLLIGARFVQGLGAGAVMPIGMATVYELFPPSRRGMAMGVWGVAIMAAPAVGPPFGGWMVDVASWRLLFVLFAAFAVAATALTLRYLPDVGNREPRPFDLLGWLLASTGVVALVVGSRQVADWGPLDTRTLAVAVIGVGVLVLVVMRSLRQTHPIIEFRIFAVPTFAAGTVVVWLSSMNQLGQLTFLPIELQVVRDLEAGHVGVLLAPAAIGVALTMPLGGWLVDRVGARAPVLVGSVLMAAGTFELSRLRPDGSERSLVLVLILVGVGQGLVFIPTTVATMNSLPTRFVAQASVVNSLNRQIGGAVGVAALSAVAVASLGSVAPEAADVVPGDAQDAYNRVFLVSAVTAVVCAAVCILLPGRRRTMADHRARAAEIPDQSDQVSAESR